jgi:hypothetical protein
MELEPRLSEDFKGSELRKEWGYIFEGLKRHFGDTPMPDEITARTAELRRGLIRVEHLLLMNNEESASAAITKIQDQVEMLASKFDEKFAMEWKRPILEFSNKVGRISHPRRDF